MGAIYAIQNLANGKVYVGQTVKPSWKARYRCTGKPQVNPRQRLLYRAYKSQGHELFRFEDLMTGVPDFQLDFWEKFWIESLGATDRDTGYNLESGGRSQKSITEETRQLHRIAMIGKNKGKTWKWPSSRRKSYAHHLHPMYRKHTWSHPIHGRFVGGGRELKQAFPNQRLQASNLSKVVHGIRPHCGGWKCLDSTETVN